MDVFRLGSAFVLLLGLHGAARVMAQDRPADAELAAILAKWRTAVADLERFEIRGYRMVYNNVFETEKQANYVIHYESPQSIRLESQPIEVPQGRQSLRINRQTGQPYRIESDRASLWVWNHCEVIHYSPGTGQRISEELILPVQHEIRVNSKRGPPPPDLPEDPVGWWEELLNRMAEFYLAGFRQTCLPKNEGSWEQSWGLLGMLLHPEMQVPALFAADSPAFVEEMDWTIARRKEKSIIVSGKPRSVSNRDLFQQFDVLLDTITGRPLAQRTIEPSGNLETVIVFQEWNLMPKPFERSLRRKNWDYEVFPLPEDFSLLKHRRKK